MKKRTPLVHIHLALILLTRGYTNFRIIEYLEAGERFRRLLTTAKSFPSKPESRYKVGSKIRLTQSKDVYGNVNYEIRLKSHRLLFASRHQGRYVAQSLRNLREITKRELMMMNIPREDRLVSILKQYDVDTQRRHNAEKRMEELSMEINGRIMLDVYGFKPGGNESDIIRDHLERFEMNVKVE